VRCRQTKADHDGVTDELIEHAALLVDALDHQREVFIEERDGALRAVFLGDGGEAAIVGSM
jgi:hypothetical protein